MTDLRDDDYGENFISVVDLLESEGRPMRCLEICESLDLKPGTVRKYLRRATQRDLIDRLFRGVYVSKQ